MQAKIYRRMRKYFHLQITCSVLYAFCFFTGSVAKPQPVAEHDLKFNYSIPEEKPGLVYKVKVIDRYKGDSTSGYEKQEKVSGTLRYRKSTEKDDVLVATARLQTLDISGEEEKHPADSLLAQLTPMSLPYKLSESGAPQETSETKQKARQQLKESKEPEILRDAARLFRGFLLATIPLPEDDAQADNTGCYTWTSDADICIHDSPMEAQAYPLADAIVITAQTSLKNDNSAPLSFKQKPDKLVAIWKGGRIVKGEYRAYVGGHEMVVKIVHTAPDEMP